MTTYRLAALATATVLGATGLTACGSSSSDSSAPSSASSAAPSSAAPSSAAASSAAPSASSSASSSAPAKAAVITIKDYKYVGASSVAPGTKVTVKNEDSEAHTVTTDAGKTFDVTVPPGASATFTAPAKSGAYKYHCTYHADMHGTLTVS